MLINGALFFSISISEIGIEVDDQELSEAESEDEGKESVLSFLAMNKGSYCTCHGNGLVKVLW